jgi:hypothetical protein
VSAAFAPLGAYDVNTCSAPVLTSGRG